MSKNAYACSYCGDVIIANGNQAPLESNKCNKCGASKYVFVSDEETYTRFFSENKLHLLLKFKCNNYIDSWKAHNINLTPKSGEQQEYTSTYNAPRCPTCGGTELRHISGTERGVNAVVFGFFGNKRKYQFQCLNPNCKYTW